MTNETFSTVIIIFSLILLAFCAGLAYMADNEFQNIQRSLDAKCKIIANDKDFIANDKGCYIKYEY